MTVGVLLLAFVLVAVAVAGCGSTTTTAAPATTTAAPAGSTTTTAPSAATTTSAAGADKTVNLSAVSFLDKNHPLCSTIPIWVDLVKQKTNGSVIVTYKGGPEVINANDQFAAVSSGAIDVVFETGTYYEKQNMATKAMLLSQVKPWEERTPGGMFDYMVGLHQKLGVQYIGRWMSDVPFYVWVNKPITSYTELKGMSLRSTANYELFFKALGINGVTVDAAEVYTALERNIVQGFGFTILGPRTSGWTSITKYYIDVPWWGAQNAGILMSPKTWAGLSPNQQAQVAEATVEFEHQMYTKLADMQVAEKAELVKQGVKPITLSADEAKAFRDLAYSSLVDGLAALVPGEIATIKKLTGLQ
jgi:TRAP-type C4-dicarboxylate transport system substrate-binding protein